MQAMAINTTLLTETARAMVATGKGIIAADESNKSCNARFEAVGLPTTEDARRKYREMIFSTPGLAQYVSGIILYDETFRQKTGQGAPFPEFLQGLGIIPGIKVDTGVVEMALHPGEKVTEGLDGLRDRLREYATGGARFAKWRAVITISATTPTPANIAVNAHTLARYAAYCQEAGIVPIIEPEVLIDGDHTIEQSYEATRATLAEAMAQLKAQDVFLPGVILKASMVIAGKGTATPSTPEQVGEMTVRCLRETVPTGPGGIHGIVFLSGGQSDEQATANLNAMNQHPNPWPLTFSYSRAIQNPALAIYAKAPDMNIHPAQQALFFRTKMNSLASQGQYRPEMEAERGY
jgi:fructose-bisphosphate aldolase, class I